MSGTLKDQLLKAGLVDREKLKAEKKAEHRAKKQRQRGKTPKHDETKQRAETARRAKLEHDRQRNSERERQRELRAARAQVREIVDRHRLERQSGETPFQFADRGKIKKIYVHASMPGEIAAGRLAVVRLDGNYDIVPAAAAARIVERDPRAVVVLNDAAAAAEKVADDPYADYPVPDDLTW